MRPAPLSQPPTPLTLSVFAHHQPSTAAAPAAARTSTPAATPRPAGASATGAVAVRAGAAVVMPPGWRPALRRSSGRPLGLL